MNEPQKLSQFESFKAILLSSLEIQNYELAFDIEEILYEHYYSFYISSVEIQRQLGIAYSKTGNYDVAIKYFKLIVLKEGLPQDYFELGKISFEKNQFREATEYLQIAIQRQPNFPEAYFYLGRALTKSSSFTEDSWNQIIECFDRAITQQPNFPQAFFELGLIFNQLDDCGAAIACFSTAIKQNPHYMEAYVKRRETYLKMSQDSSTTSTRKRYLYRTFARSDKYTVSQLVSAEEYKKISWRSLKREAKLKNDYPDGYEQYIVNLRNWVFFVNPSSLPDQIDPRNVDQVTGRLKVKIKEGLADVSTYLTLGETYIKFHSKIILALVCFSTAIEKWPHDERAYIQRAATYRYTADQLETAGESVEAYQYRTLAFLDYYKADDILRAKHHQNSESLTKIESFQRECEEKCQLIPEKLFHPTITLQGGRFWHAFHEKPDPKLSAFSLTFK